MEKAYSISRGFNCSKKSEIKQNYLLFHRKKAKCIFHLTLLYMCSIILLSAFLNRKELDFLGCNCCNRIVLPCHHISTFLAQTLEYVEAIHNAGRKIRIQPLSSWTSLHSFIFHTYLILMMLYFYTICPFIPVFFYYTIKI